MDEATITAAKKFADGVNGIGGGNLNSVVDLLGESTKTAYNNFRAKVNASGVLDSKQTGYLLSALGQAGGAIGEVLATTLNGQRPTSTVTKSGITVTSNIQGTSPQRHTYTVKQDVNVCKAGDALAACVVNVDLTLVLDFPAAPTGAQSETALNLTAASGLRVNITTGVLKNANLSATVTPISTGHVQFSGLNFAMDSSVKPNWKSSSVLSLNFTNLTLNLPLTLQQLGVSNPVSAAVTLTGSGPTIKADVSLLARDAAAGAGTTTISRTRLDVFALQGLGIDATAEIKDSTESLKVTKLSLDVNGDKVAVDEDPFDDVPAAPVYVVILDTNRTCDAGGACKNESVIDTQGETATEYLEAALDLEAGATLTGVTPVTIKALGERSSDEILSLDSLDITGEDTLDLSADFNLARKLVSLDAANKAGLKLVITSNSSGARTGTLVTGNGQKVADVIEQGGRVTFNYVDGTSKTY